MRTLRPMKCTAFVACVLLATGAAQAADVANAEAERLFRQGRQALEARKYAEARDRFEASLKLYPGTGVKLNLGTCYVALDELEKAEAMFRAAETEAKAKDESTRLNLAREGLADVEKHKATLVLRFVPALPAEAEVQLDGKALARVQALSSIPLFKGVHALRVKVPGEAALEKNIEVPKSGAHQTVQVELPASWVARPPRTESTRGNSQRTAGLIVGGVGAVGLVSTGVMTFLYGSSIDWKLTDPNDTTSSQRRDTVNTYTYLGLASGALLATGAVIYFTAPSHDEATASLQVVPTAGGAAAVLGGRF